ncbi:hypothetical protein J6S88_01395 [bacterium]|nr:hypothetical protein [bacterium]
MCNRKIIFVLLILVILTFVCAVKIPAMHKPFQLNIIEYILKFNDDGSMTTTKTTTTTTIINEGADK